MDKQKSDDVLKSRAYEAEVASDEREAVARGIYAIPDFDFDGKFSTGCSLPLNGFRESIKRMIQMKRGE